MQLLSGKVIFLTGGSAGIGFECAKAYAEAGANVVVAASSPEPVEDAVRQLGSAHLGIVCDVSKADDVEIAIAKTLARYGKLDAIHNNAGVASPSKPLHETSDEEWGNLMDVNLKSILYTTRY